MDAEKLEQLKAERNRLNAEIKALEAAEKQNQQQMISENLSPELKEQIAKLSPEKQALMKRQLGKFGLAADEAKVLLTTFAELEEWKIKREEAAEAARLRRERNIETTAARAKEAAEEERRNRLTPVQIIEDEIITQRQMTDMENNCFTSYRRPGDCSIRLW